MRNKGVADGKQDICLGGIACTQAMRKDTKRHPANDIDDQDQHTGNRIAFHEFRCTIHRAVEIRLGRHVLSPDLGFVRCHQSGVQIGVDRHLLAGQRVEREARRDFGDAPCALGDHDQIDDHEDQENENPDCPVAADQKFAKRFDDMTRRTGPFMTTDKNDACRCDIQCQTKQGGKQQHSGKG